ERLPGGSEHEPQIVERSLSLRGAACRQAATAPGILGDECQTADGCTNREARMFGRDPMVIGSGWTGQQGCQGQQAGGSCTAQDGSSRGREFGRLSSRCPHYGLLQCGRKTVAPTSAR